MGELLPDPVFLGLPSKFDGWRRNQERAILAAIDSPKRAVVLNAPTGFGKTLVYAAVAGLTGKRAAFLTATKGLQSQLGEDFGSSGLVDIRGQGNYKCRALAIGGELRGQAVGPGEQCDVGPCHAGAACSLRDAGCTYFDQVREARRARSNVANYTYWIAQHRYSDGLGTFDILVLDEAHEADSELCASLEVELTQFDVETVLGASLPTGDDCEVWRQWARSVSAKQQPRLDHLNAQIKQYRQAKTRAPHAMLREAHALKGQLNRINVLAQMKGDWIIEHHGRSAKAAPIWPAPYAEQYLFLNIPKLIFVSATIQGKTMDLLGLSPADVEFHEYPSTFPVERRPVVHVPSVRCKHTWSDVEQRTWVRRIDQIIDRRLDRKGIIHTTSYERRNLILTYSEHRDLMFTNDGTNTRTIVERFRAAEPPAILVSPSLTTGWDLPLDACEYAIIGKIPFPDTRSPIIKARTSQDDDYGPYIAMQTIIQASGRGMRSADDQCEVFIVDDNWVWFWPKYGRKKKFAPRWFAEAVCSSATIPSPLPKLKKEN